MRPGRPIAVAAALALQLPGAQASAPAPVPPYTFIDLAPMLQEPGVPTNILGPSSMATGINDHGHIVGTMDIPGGAFLFDGFTVRPLGSLGGSGTYPQDISNRGLVVGRSLTEAGHTHAFLWDGSRMLDLGTLGGDDSEALAVNEVGHVVGVSSLVPGLAFPRHAFLWDGAHMHDLGTLGGPGSFAADINDRGQIVGGTSVPRHSEDPAWPFAGHPFLYEGGVLRSLVPPEGLRGLPPLDVSGGASALNNAGQVAGTLGPLEVSHSYGQRGFLLDARGFHDLGTLQGFGLGEATDISESGVVVGTSLNIGFIGPDARAVLFDGEELHDLHPGWPVDSTFAHAINGADFVVGEAWIAPWLNHAALWRPGHPPQPVASLQPTLPLRVSLSMTGNGATVGGTRTINWLERLFRDNGPKTLYTRPFEVRGNGLYALHYYSLDEAGPLGNEQVLYFTVVEPAATSGQALGVVVVRREGILEATVHLCNLTSSNLEGVRITHASLREQTVVQAESLPKSQGTVAPGGSASAVLRPPGHGSRSTAMGVLSVAWTSSAGAGAAAYRLRLP